MNGNQAVVAPYGANLSRRLTRIRDYRQVINARLDGDEISSNAVRVNNRPKDVYYKNQQGVPIRPDRTHAGQELVAYGYQVVAIARAAAFSGMRNPAPRNQGNMDSRVPIVPTLNGAAGKSVSEVEEKYRPIGFVELPGRNSPTDGATVVRDAMIDITANFEDLFLGDHVMAAAPNTNQVSSIKSDEGNGADGKNGRIPWILKRYEPEREDFYRADFVREVILNRLMKFEEDTANAGTYFLVFRSVQERKAESAIEEDSNNIMKKFIKSQAALLQFGNPALNKNQARTRAAAFCLLSGQKFIGTAYKNDLANTGNVPAGSNAATVQTAVEGQLDAILTRNAANTANLSPAEITARKKMLSNNPVQAALVAMAHKNKRIQERVMGMMAADAPKGTTGTLHMHAY